MINILNRFFFHKDFKDVKGIKAIKNSIFVTKTLHKQLKNSHGKLWQNLMSSYKEGITKFCNKKI